MKIAIDGYEIHKKFTGVGRYLDNLLQNLLKINPDDKFTLLVTEENTSYKEFNNLEILLLPHDASYTRWQNLILLKALRKGNYDLFFSPDHSLPLFYRGRSFMTLHDPSWRAKPKDYSVKERRIRDIKTRISIKRSELVFTVSEFSRSEILKFYSVNQAKVIAIPHGIEPSFKPASDSEVSDFKLKNGIKEKEPVLGFLGSMFGRRHIKEMLIGYLKLREKINARIFVIGKNHYGREIDELLNSDGVIYRDRLAEEDMNVFYSSLDLFLYLSDYEGFGFPPLEALSCGTISLLLQGSSLSEIFKNIAVFINRPEPEAIAGEILRTLKDLPRLKQDIVSEFRQKKQYFSWQRVAESYLRYFQKP